MPSTKEGWGITILEAASCGTPSVGFDVPGVRDSIKDRVTGLLANSDSEYILKVELLLQSEKLRNVLGINSKRWSKKFSWNTSANVFEEVISAIHAHKELLSDKVYPWDLDLTAETISSLVPNK